MTEKHHRCAAIGLCVVLLLCWMPNPIAAADDLENPVANASLRAVSDDQSAFAMLVTPTRLVIDSTNIGTPQQIQVINRGQSALTVAVQKRNFTAAPDGSLAYQEDAPYSASEWVSVEPVGFQLEPGATQTVTATVAMPPNPDAGDHQLAIIFMVPAEESSANIKVAKGIGMSVYITVPGQLEDSVSLSNLTAPGFATGGPVTITATVHDTGNVHKDYRGASPLLVDAPGTAEPFPDFTVTRDSIRDISTTWDPPLLGIFNPMVTLTNADGTTSSASVRVIVFPIQKAAILLGALLLLFFGVWFSRRRYKASVRKAALTMNSATGGGDA